MVSRRIVWQVVDVATPDEQHRLQLVSGETVRRFGSVIAGAGPRLTYERLVHPARRLPKQGEVEIGTLAALNGVTVAMAHEQLGKAVADPMIAQHLAIAVGTAVMLLDRIIKADTGEPIEWRLAYFKP